METQTITKEIDIAIYPDELAAVFAEWSSTEQAAFLLEAGRLMAHWSRDPDGIMPAIERQAMYLADDLRKAPACMAICLERVQRFCEVLAKDMAG